MKFALRTLLLILRTRAQVQPTPISPFLNEACGLIKKNMYLKIISNRVQSCDEKLSELTERPLFGHKAEKRCE
jgi:hypothetical protein